ncbi:MAG: Ig-like domain-containing protein, partial [Thermodesulfobacteriota bacterium]|nr:Ig-like domain-containing protein [Thermodesulfobacteriota bacterium]
GPAEAYTYDLSGSRLDHQLEQSGLYTIVIQDYNLDHSGTYSVSMTKIPSTLRQGIYSMNPSSGSDVVSGSVTLSWDGVAGATGYDVYLASGVVSPFERIGDNISSTSITVDGLEAGRRYTWRVVAHHPTGDIVSPCVWLTTTGSANQLPVAHDDLETTDQDTPVSINVISNDVDVDGTTDPTSVAILSGPSEGSVINNLDGTVTYTPDTGFTGNDAFTYTVQDNEGATSNEATVTVMVLEITAGACCMPDGSCTEGSATECASAGGTYQGDGSDCASANCAQPEGACCMPDGSCTEGTSSECASAGGSYQGNGTDCASANCAQPEGACCMPDGSCTEGTSSECASAGGSYQGNGTDCASANCAQPEGACCLPDGSCMEAIAIECTSAGGTYQGNGTDCASANCAQPEGACCLPDGSCMEAIAIECTSAGGTYQGNGTDCASANCGGFARTLCSTLGDDPRPYAPDMDVFKFTGTERETVTVTLESSPPAYGAGQRAVLIMRNLGNGLRLFKRLNDKLPLEMTVTLPMTGDYHVKVMEAPGRAVIWGEKYEGDYCVTLDASPNTMQTFVPDLDIE